VNAALEQVGIGMKMRAYRQWQAQIVNVIRRRERNNDANMSVTALLDCETEGGAMTEVERAAVEQAGHTSREGGGILQPDGQGRGSRDRPADVLPIYRLESVRWQVALRLRPDDVGPSAASLTVAAATPVHSVRPIARALPFTDTPRRTVAPEAMVSSQQSDPSRHLRQVLC
jgi:hypothetical protein